jgi:prevent-host-death family protein
MKRVPIAALKARLSSYLREARAGKSLLLTEAGRPVATLGPVTPADDEEGWLQSLAQAGLVKAPEAPLPEDFLDTPPQVQDPEGRLRRSPVAGREE